VPASLHLLLVEPDPHRAQTVTRMLVCLGMLSTRVATTYQATAFLTQIQPDGLLIGVDPMTTRELRAWLAALLPANPLRTLLYAEHGTLLDVARLGLPPVISTMLWPCSQSDLALLVTPLPPLSMGERL